MIYIVSFCISIFFIKLADSFDRENSGRYVRILLLLSALPLILLAALRNDTIGTDVHVYQKPLFEIAKNSASLGRFIKFEFPTFEPLYLLITYIASRLGSIFWLFLFNETIIIIFTYLSIWRYRHQVDASLMLGVFLLIFYCKGYNITRQSIAVSIVMYMFVKLSDGKYLQTLILLFIAIGFHFSAISACSVILLYYISKRKIKLLYEILIFAVSITISVFFREVFIFFANHLPFIPVRYFRKWYMNIEGGANIYASNIILYLLALILALVLIYNKRIAEEPYGHFLVFSMVFAAAGAIVSSQAKVADRVFLYNQIFIIFTLAQFPKLFKSNYANMIIAKSTLWIALVGYWIFDIIIKCRNEVYPYMLLE